MTPDPSRLVAIRKTLHPTDPSYCAEPLEIEDARWLLAQGDALELEQRTTRLELDSAGVSRFNESGVELGNMERVRLLKAQNWTVVWDKALVERVQAAEATVLQWTADRQAWQRVVEGYERQLDAQAQAIQTLTAERDEYRTLAKIGPWHNDCRPNRHKAAQELQKAWDVRDKLADRITELEARFSRLTEALEQIRKAAHIVAVNGGWGQGHAENLGNRVARLCDAALAPAAASETKP